MFCVKLFNIKLTAQGSFAVTDLLTSRRSTFQRANYQRSAFPTPSFLHNRPSSSISSSVSTPNVSTICWT